MSDHVAPTVDPRVQSLGRPLEHDVILEVVPYKTAALTARPAGSSLAASVTALGIVTVPPTANRNAEPEDVVERLYGWVFDERDDAICAKCHGIDLRMSPGATRDDRR